MIHAKGFFGIAMVVAGVAARANAAELQSTTERAWQEYVRAAGIRLQARVEGRKPFLWMDEAPDRCGPRKAGRYCRGAASSRMGRKPCLTD